MAKLPGYSLKQLTREEGQGQPMLSGCKGLMVDSDLVLLGKSLRQLPKLRRSSPPRDQSAEPTHKSFPCNWDKEANDPCVFLALRL